MPVRRPEEPPHVLPVLTPAEHAALCDLFTAVSSRTSAPVFVRVRVSFKTGRPVAFVTAYLPNPKGVMRRVVVDQYGDD